jgi:RHS repeat-associated protein
LGCLKLTYQPVLEVHEQNSFLVKSAVEKCDHEVKKRLSSFTFGFQGQEGDSEVKGKGNSWNYKYRMHDARLGRFFAVDPLSPKYAMLTPYQFSSNCPIGLKELEGLEGADWKFDLIESQLNGPKLGMTSDEYLNILQPFRTIPIGLHELLDGLGFVPVFGEVFDGANAAIYTYKGDYLNAAFSSISVIPVGGDLAAKGFKYGLKGAGFTGRTFKSLKSAKKWLGNAMETTVKSADAIANRSKLRGALKIATGAADRAHHVIPINLIKKNKNVQKAIDEGFDFNGVVNGAAIDKARHTGSHGKYDDAVNGIINDAFSNPDNVNKSAKELVLQLLNVAFG